MGSIIFHLGSISRVPLTMQKRQRTLHMPAIVNNVQGDSERWFLINLSLPHIGATINSIWKWDYLHLKAHADEVVKWRLASFFSFIHITRMGCLSLFLLPSTTSYSRMEIVGCHAFNKFQFRRFRMDIRTLIMAGNSRPLPKLATIGVVSCNWDRIVSINFSMAPMALPHLLNSGTCINVLN